MRNYELTIWRLAESTTKQRSERTTGVSFKISCTTAEALALMTEYRDDDSLVELTAI